MVHIFSTWFISVVVHIVCNSIEQNGEVIKKTDMLLHVLN